MGLKHAQETFTRNLRKKFTPNRTQLYLVQIYGTIFLGLFHPY